MGPSALIHAKIYGLEGYLAHYVTDQILRRLT